MKIYEIYEYIRSPEYLVNFLTECGIESEYDSDESELKIPSLERLGQKKIKTLKPETKDYDFDIMEMTDFIPALNLDHRESTYQTEDMLMLLNSALHSKGMEIIEFDTRSDYSLHVITKLGAKSIESVYRGSAEIINKDLEEIDLEFKKLYRIKEESEKPFKNEISIYKAASVISRNLDEKTVNYELLVDFLNDVDPEYNYEIAEKKGRIGITRNKFED
tara:strand:+ start:49315 stop:49971 length:657 start_codon:yes stop_codon:yes gene_type:complete